MAANGRRQNPRQQVEAGTARRQPALPGGLDNADKIAYNRDRIFVRGAEWLRTAEI